MYWIVYLNISGTTLHLCLQHHGDHSQWINARMKGLQLPVADHPVEEDDDDEVLDHITCAGNIIIEVLTIVCTSLPRLRPPFLVLDHSQLVRNSKVLWFHVNFIDLYIWMTPKHIMKELIYFLKIDLISNFIASSSGCTFNVWSKRKCSESSHRIFYQTL